MKFYHKKRNIHYLIYFLNFFIDYAVTVFDSNLIAHEIEIKKVIYNKFDLRSFK